MVKSGYWVVHSVMIDGDSELRTETKHEMYLIIFVKSSIQKNKTQNLDWKINIHKLHHKTILVLISVKNNVTKPNKMSVCLFGEEGMIIIKWKTDE